MTHPPSHILVYSCRLGGGEKARRPRHGRAVGSFQDAIKGSTRRTRTHGCRRSIDSFLAPFLALFLKLCWCCSLSSLSLSALYGALSALGYRLGVFELFSFFLVLQNSGPLWSMRRSTPVRHLLFCSHCCMTEVFCHACRDERGKA